MTAVKVSEAGVEVLHRVLPAVRVAEAGVEYLHRVLPGLTVSEAGVEYLHRVQPAFAISQAGVEFLHKAQPCLTRRAQIWTITRTDGAVLRFTSLDRDLDFAGHTYAACNSLQPSASEELAEVSQAGNVELSGLIASGAISQDDLHRGLYDGARVEAHLVNWDGPRFRKAILAGTFGPVSFDANGFSVDIMGDGARLTQTPLVRTLQPNCRYQFGDALCGKDVAPLTVTGTVTAANRQRGFTDAARAEAAGYFSRGRVTFTSGANAGISAEIKEHLAGGIIALWPRLAFEIEVGDGYAMVPGCTNMLDASGGCNGCTAWANAINYGGEPNVPGRDKRGSQPDVKR
ncbi:putative phage protein (TIGR02218 family) [Novosphingobium kunmingense]|uniref:Putative phage protein (TIGR02218 family) n=1 Tax=Novosphingobium kunmingense TaxID=1211806 RepID=A0A2N0HL18_9SPHN|nr:DUF2163 domain-containing protein [Novosphingobium kunmingense]PKB19663.1 putative phage protein (TIGR02218 family) [Novosphingobium kunmingense]